MLFSMHTEKIGKKGKHIVILHGWGHSLDSMRPLAQLLAAQHQVHLIDLPGFGKSPVPETVWNSFDYAKQIETYLLEQRIEKAILAGHSFGGKVAFSLAYQNPSLVEKLILISSAGLKPTHKWREKIQSRAVRLYGKGYKWVDSFFGTHLFQHHFIPKYGSKDYQNAGPMRSILVKSVNEDLSPILTKITQPTLILWGEADTQVSLKEGQRFNRLISQSTLLSFPRKGHNLPLGVGAHLCARYMIPFIGASE